MPFVALDTAFSVTELFAKYRRIEIYAADYLHDKQENDDA